MGIFPICEGGFYIFGSTTKVGNISVVTNQSGNECIVKLYNGSDCIFSDTYMNVSNSVAIGKAEERALRHFDMYTYVYLSQNFLNHLVKLSDNTYRINDDYFCRIDDTRYFKHLKEPAGGWTVDKEGMRIIDR